MLSTTAARRAEQTFSRCAVLGSIAALLLALGAHAATAQAIDCERLKARIAQGDRGGARGTHALKRQAAELARTQAYAHQLGCDGFSFFGGNPQCSGLNARIAGLQAGLAQLQSAEGGSRNDLVTRYDAYCRDGQTQQPSRPRGFFESLFGGGGQPEAPPPPTAAPAEQAPAAPEDAGSLHARGGSQAVCVRSCDGGFFPLGLSSRRSGEDLTEMCQALCPGTDVAVFTRNPDNDIKTAVGLDGKAYMDLPNALKFQKSVTPACSCRQAGKNWAETLANAEEVLGNGRKGDILVTPEKSAEMSRPVLDAKTRSALVAGSPSSTEGKEGGKRTDATRAVRQVGPQP